MTGHHSRDPEPATREERHAEAVATVLVLAEALAGRLDEVARTAGPPGDWWFTDGAGRPSSPAASPDAG